ncbi:hypothetical protein I3259_15550 [Photobacterium sp. Ph5]|nr:hypothetical protein [Photobacterium sp. Ph6]MCG3876992.1 hypothetical protein [Photobacterium sp. Ph5]
MYHDKNGNGTADTGEPVINNDDVVSVGRGQSYDIILVAAVPVTAVGTDTIGITLTAKAYEGTSGPVTGAVSDEGIDYDGAPDTNADLIRITTDAVVNINKTATHIVGAGTEASLGIEVDTDGGNDLPVNLIKYEIKATNTGNKAAEKLVIFDGVPEGTVLVKTSTGSLYNPTSSGFLGINGDTPITAEDDITNEALVGVDLDKDGNQTDNGETDLDGGLDLNGNGSDTDMGIAGVYAIDESLAQSSSVLMTFYVAYSPSLVPGDTEFYNTAYACADLDGDNAYISPGECNDPNPQTAGPDTSDKTKTDSETKYGIDITDTGINHNGDFTGNGGGDDDGTSDDIQTVDTAAAGSEVIFFNIVTNEGNVDDIFNLSYDTGTSTFPADTIVEYWNADGSAKLVDNSSPTDNIDDTGQIFASTCDNSSPQTLYGFTINCNQKLIRVVVKLPANGAKTTESTMTVTATSNGDNSLSDTKIEKLGEISAPTVDVANRPFTTAEMDVSVDVQPVDVSDGFDKTDVAQHFNDVALGSIVNADIYIANKGGVSDSFTLGAEGSYNTGSSSWNAALPAGWSVTFIDNGITNGLTGAVIKAPSSTVITQTSSLAPNAVQHVIAKISVPSDTAQALANSNQADAIDGNATPDGDLDYIISIVVTSDSTLASNRKVEAIDVESFAAIAISPTARNQQVEAGGTVSYAHTLTNTGNTTEDILLTSTNNKPGFSNTILIDINGNGTLDTELGNVCSILGGSGTVDVLQTDNVTVITVEVTCDDATDTTPEFTLEPGEKIPMSVTVLTPNSASNGLVNITDIKGETTGGSGLEVNAKDSTKIVEGQVRLRKYASLDGNCDGVADNDKDYRVQYDDIKPGQCIIWKLVAINQGTTDAMNTVISDQLTGYTEFADVSGNIGGLLECRNMTDTGDIKQPTSADYALKFDDVGPLCNPSAGTGGDIDSAITVVAGESNVIFTVNGPLVAGDIAVGQFVVKIKE